MLTDEQVILSHYDQALRSWRPEYGPRVRVERRRSVVDWVPIPEAEVHKPYVADLVEYRAERGYLDYQPVYRITGRYNDTEIELDIHPVRRRNPRNA